MLRPLSVAGRRQAEGLVIRLEDFPVERILCGPTLRCRQTVEPLARDRFLEMEPVEALGLAQRSEWTVVVVTARPPRAAA